MNIFHCFSFCTGLRVNLDKNEAIWVPSGLGSDNKLLPVKHLAWNTSGKFKLLGIHFNLYKEDKTFENYGEKIKKGKEYLKLMGIQGLNLFWPNNGYKNISHPTFGADSHNTTKPSCSRYERNKRHFQ